MEKNIKEIERSLIKTYRKNIWVKFVRAVNEYELVDDRDRIAVAISGGKDSLTLAKAFQELARHGKKNFELEFICMDPGYKPEIRAQIEKNCKILEIPVKIHDSDVFQVAYKMAEENPCYMCARMRRGNLYAKAQELNCNKLALGHHFDDVIETIMLNILYAGNYKTMMPKLKSDNFENMELIRPLYLVEEEAIIRFIKNSGVEAIDCACTVTERNHGSKRDYIKNLIKEIRKVHDNAGISIFRSAENINLEAIVGWKDSKGKHSFLDNY